MKTVPTQASDKYWLAYDQHTHDSYRIRIFILALGNNEHVNRLPLCCRPHCTAPIRRLSTLPIPRIRSPMDLSLLAQLLRPRPSSIDFGR